MPFYFKAKCDNGLCLSKAIVERVRIFFEKSFSPSLPPTCLTTSCTKIAKRLVVFKFHIWAKRFHYNAHYSKVLRKGKLSKGTG